MKNVDREGGPFSSGHEFSLVLYCTVGSNVLQTSELLDPVEIGGPCNLQYAQVNEWNFEQKMNGIL